MKAEFDKFAETYREQHNDNLTLTGENSFYFAQYKAEKLKSWITLLKKDPSTILDFGCGDGLMTHQVQLQFNNTQICGIDPSQESIGIAKKNYQSIDFQTSGKHLTMFNEEHFDLIYTAAVFHHIPFEEHKHYIQELVKLLKKDGLLVIFEHNPLNPGTQYLFNTCPLDVNATMMPHWYTKTLVQSYGKITTKFYAFFPKLLGALKKLEPYLEWCPLGGLYAVILKKQ